MDEKEILNQILDSTRKQNQLLEKQLELLQQYFDLDVDTDEDEDDDENWWNGEVDPTKTSEFIKEFEKKIRYDSIQAFVVLCFWLVFFFAGIFAIMKLFQIF